jgi:hypothetical protein
VGQKPPQLQQVASDPLAHPGGPGAKGEVPSSVKNRLKQYFVARNT